MNKITKRKLILSNTSSLDISIIKERIGFIQTILESPNFEGQLSTFLEDCKQIHHKNIELDTCNFVEAIFASSLPYMCFLPCEIIALNSFMCDIMKRSNLSQLFFPLEDILQHVDDIHDLGPFIVDIRMLKTHLLRNLPWYFMNEFMDALGLSKFTSLKKNTKNVDMKIKPLDKMKKSFGDNVRIAKKKLEEEDLVMGQNQLGWLFVSQKITEEAEHLNVKDFILEDMFRAMGSITRGLIPESHRHLDIFILSKPSSLDKRNLYDKLYLFYQRMRPDDVQFEKLQNRLVGLGSDPKIIRQETSKYYEALSKKMNRYFGIEFSEVY